VSSVAVAHTATSPGCAASVTRSARSEAALSAQPYVRRPRSARERLFGFINGQSGASNAQSQGFVHLIRDGHASEDASAGNTRLIDALRKGGDLLNVFGDFPTEKINCAVIGFTDKPPTANLAQPVPGSQFPPR
jgi:hypothetical protein